MGWARNRSRVAAGREVVIAIDTNVLVRILVEDDVAQTRSARSLVERAATDGAALFVSTVVICETTWVLRSGYRSSRTEIAAALRWVADRIQD